MSPIANTPLLAPAVPSPNPAGPGRIKDAAEQFEALLLGQILRSARESNGGSNDCATEFAEQQLSTVLAKRGGLGIGRMIQQGLGAAQKLQA
jgi:Rod binding domain-containing protein